MRGWHTETPVQMNNCGAPTSPHHWHSHLHLGKLCWVSDHGAECYINAKQGYWGQPILQPGEPQWLHTFILDQDSILLLLVRCFNIMCQKPWAIFSFVHKLWSLGEAFQRKNISEKVCTWTWSFVFKLWLQCLIAVWSWVSELLLCVSVTKKNIKG